MARAEHPLVAAHRAHAAAHLVGQGLEAQRPVARASALGDGGARPVGGLSRQENVDGSSKRRFKRLTLTRKGNWRAHPRLPPQGNLKAVDGIQKNRARTRS